MPHRRRSLVAALVLLVLLAVSGAALASKAHSDPVGDVQGGAGPDVAAVTLSHTSRTITFRVRFAQPPPLGVSTRAGWVDMLLIGIDVPPLARRWATPRGEWLAPNFAAGTHGASKAGKLVRVGRNIPAGRRLVGSFKVVTSGSSLSFTIPRRLLGNPAVLAIGVAAGRELPEGAEGGGSDLAPDHGFYRYTLTG